MSAVTSMRVYYWMTSEDQHREMGAYVFIGIVIVMIFLGIVWAYISVIKDITPVPHNGCRPRKGRRV